MGALILRLSLVSALLGSAAGAGYAQGRNSEAQIKAAYLYQFGGFIEWPPRAFGGDSSPFVIGLIGADDIAAELESVVATRTVQGRKVSVRRLRRGEPLNGLHVLFVGGEAAGELAPVVAAAKDTPLLVVTDSEDALARGSTINFVAVDNRVRFDVALPSAQRSQLRISSRLLSVARRVVKAEG